MSAFPFPDPPHPYESLLGFVARNAAKHACDKITAVLRVAKIQTPFPQSLPTIHCGKSADIAAAFKANPDEIAARMHPHVASEGKPDSYIDFFGTPIRKAFREVVQRRVSPTSLKQSDHHRAIWDIRVFSFCPDSKEILISTCPACQKRLGWKFTIGISWCEECGKDLRKFPQKTVHVDDSSALDFVVNLIHPSKDRKQAARAATPQIFGDLNNSELFECVIGVACAATTEPDAPCEIMSRLRTPADFSRLTPQVLASAGRVILDWPVSFHILANEMRDKSAARAGHWGKEKELGPVLFLLRDRHLPAQFKDALNSEINANMAQSNVTLRRAEQRLDDEFMPIRQAESHYGLHHSVLRRLALSGAISGVRDGNAKRSLFLLKCSDVEKVAADKADAIAAVRAAKVMGIDCISLKAIADAKLIRRTDEAAASMLKGDHYSLKSINSLTDAVIAKLLPINAADMPKLSPKPLPWFQILTAILDGKIIAYRQTDTANNSFIAQISLSKATLDGFQGQVGDAAALPEFINTHQAMALLQANGRFLAALIKSGMLPTTNAKENKIRSADVIAFRANYMLTVEIARRLNCATNQVRERMAKIGVKQVCALSAGKDLIWNREGVGVYLNLVSANS